MEIAALFLVGLSLSVDAFAVSVSNGMASKEFRSGDAFKTALIFGLFQAVMPILGWLLGSGVRRFVEDFDHWVALTLLAYIGVSMIIGAGKDEDEKAVNNPYGTRRLLIMGVATSIDALCVGIALAMDGTNIWLGSSIIGVVTFAVCYVGVYLGGRVGRLFKKYAEIAGGAALILIGLKIFIEHMFFQG